jgi:pimeloyl-ACP methyl ester carboxylesterase
MGAVAALSFATRWPDRVERLILGSAMASRLPEEIVIRARQVRIPAHREHPFWFNVNTYSGRT